MSDSDEKIEITFEGGELAKALREVRDVVERRNTIPILNTVLIEVDADRSVLIVGTNLDVEVRRSLIAVSVSAPCRFAIDAHRIADLVGAYSPGAQVVIEITGLTAILKSGRSRIRFSLLPPANFPRLTQREVAADFEMPRSLLLEALGATRHSISTDETRYYLQGVFAHVRDDRLVFASCDGFRLARFVGALPAGGEGMPDVILRTACLDKISKAVEARQGDLRVQVGDEKVAFSVGDYTLVVKVIDATYPDYQRTIPDHQPHSAVVDRDSLISALGRVGLALDGKSRAVKLSFSGDRVAVTGISAQHGEGAEEIPCGWDGGELEIGFQLKFLRDALAAIDVDDVHIGLHSSAAPALITSPSSPELSLVVMPQRVSRRLR